MYKLWKFKINNTDTKKYVKYLHNYHILMLFKNAILLIFKNTKFI